MILAIVAWLGCAVTGLLSVQYDLAWLPGPFFALFFAAVLLNMFWLKCPRCRGSLGLTNLPLTARGKWLGMKPMNYCPYCGISLDESVVAGQES
jgi:hypothetical protein